MTASLWQVLFIVLLVGTGIALLMSGLRLADAGVTRRMMGLGSLCAAVFFAVGSTEG